VDLIIVVLVKWWIYIKFVHLNSRYLRNIIQWFALPVDGKNFSGDGRFETAYNTKLKFAENIKFMENIID
jgi:hypothetical protein